MWVVNFVIMRDGERSQDDGSPRFLNPNAPFPVPDIDQTVVHRGEMFVVDDVVWDLERKTVFVEIAPAEESDDEESSPTPSSNATEVEDDIEYEDDIEVEDDVEDDNAESEDSESDNE